MSAYLVNEVNGEYLVEEKVFKSFEEYITEKVKGKELYSSRSMAECAASVSKSYERKF